MEGIFACGNVLHVHDIVDYVTEESRIAGRAAANYVGGAEGQDHSGREITVKPGYGIKYIVPHTINGGAKIGNSVDLMLRVDKM